MDKKTKYPGGYTELDFFQWITLDESCQNKIKSEYEDCDKYVENQQAPSYVPKDLTYVEENLCLDMLAGYTGQLKGGDIDTLMTNADVWAEALTSIIKDIIFRANKFNKRLYTKLGWNFYKNGIGGISIQFNPAKKSVYGIGVPEIYILRWQDILLDASSRGGDHEDDTRRGIKKRVKVDYAKRKYPHLAESIRPENGDTNTSEADQYCNIYNYEYMVTELSEDEEGNEIEEDVYYMFKTINNDVLAEPPKKTRFSQFMLVIPAIHTGRESTVTWPMGAIYPVIQTQNEINQVKSVMLEQVKHSIKNLLIILNAKAEDEAKIRREAKKVNGVVVLEGSNVQIQTPNKDQIAVALIQWYEYLRKAFDEISGRYAPEKGATEGDLSGKAIALLQNRGAVPEGVRRNNMELALEYMVSGILECVAKKMHSQPFKFEQVIDGQKMDMYFNYPVSQLPIDFDFDSPYVNVSEDEGIGYVNDLRKVDVDKIDINVKIKMDAIGHEVSEANKALIARQNGAISLKDMVKKLYPDEWKTIYDNKISEDQILSMMGELQELGKQAPEEYGGIMNQISDVINQGKQILEMSKGESKR